MYEYYCVIRILSSMYAFVAARYFRALSLSLSLSLSLCVLFSLLKILPFFCLLKILFFSSRRKSSQKSSTPTTYRTRGEQWPKHLTEADFRAVLAAAVTVAIEEVAAVTAAAEVAAAEVAGEGKRTRTSGPRARSWGDWCKRYAFL